MDSRSSETPPPTKALTHRSRAERSKAFKDSSTKLLSSMERSWLRKHGKKRYIDFDGNTRENLRRYFLAMDADGTGTITVDELLDPLIALGLAESKEQVQVLFDNADYDHSGHIEFNEFLQILKSGDNRSPMSDFFKEMTKGNLVQNADVLPFNLVVSTYRRKMLLASTMHADPVTKMKADRVMKAYAKIRDSKRLAELKLSRSLSPARVL